MSKITNNNKVMEYRTEYHSAPNSKPKRMRRKPTIQKVQSNIENISVQFNMSAVAGVLMLWVVPTMATVPWEVKLGLSGLYLLSGISY